MEKGTSSDPDCVSRTLLFGVRPPVQASQITHREDAKSPRPSSEEGHGCEVGYTVYSESELKEMGLTPKMVHDMSVQQCERACKAAIDLENQRLESEVYELVEAISRRVILHTWVWHHLNFRARSKMQDGDDNSSPKLFFMEVNKTSREITSFRCLEDADAGDPTNGCAFCSPGIQPWIFHPSNGDFVMGSPDQRRLLDYYARYEDNLPLCED